ncbi:MAG TPA: glucuronyl hydrolase [Prolixibacteraceae bacterium]|nr:glucuronyl hydrolase [Prolixibacteraceae bacterium]
MINIALLSVSVLLFTACFQTTPGSKKPDDPNLVRAGEQLNLLIQSIDNKLNTEDEPEKGGDLSMFPRSLNMGGQLKLVPSKDWCSGFFAGCLWEMYGSTGDKHWRESAIRFTEPLEDQKLNGKTHDMGFKMMNTFGKGYELTGDKNYRDILVQSAKTLITRYNEKIGCIRSWDHNQDKWQFPVIIDNMMNLELLFWASKETGDSVYYNIAVTHALTTMKNHFRSDNSCYHVVDYDAATGAVVKKNTHQGFSDESAWSRGQAWALYGYTMVYRETKNPVFLTQAEKVAQYILAQPNMPVDLVPYWDFDAPEIPNEPRDVSAAAIATSALYELSLFVSDSLRTGYLKAADQMFKNLSTSYLSAPGANNGFILGHSTGSKPHNSEIDVPIIYADYYYLEALLRKMKSDRM